MSHLIHKYELDEGVCTFQLPVSAKPIHVAEQRGKLCVWVEFEANDFARTEHTFEVVGTGVPFQKADFNHIGTVLLMGGSLVLHVYHRGSHAA